MTKEAIKQIQKELGANDALLVASIPNRFYLTGFETSDGFVFIARDTAVFLIDFRYVEKAKQIVDSCDVRLSSSPLDEIKELCEANGIQTLYVESEKTSLDFAKRLSETLASSQVKVSDSDKFDILIRDLRSIKN